MGRILPRPRIQTQADLLVPGRKPVGQLRLSEFGRRVDLGNIWLLGDGQHFTGSQPVSDYVTGETNLQVNGTLNTRWTANGIGRDFTASTANNASINTNSTYTAIDRAVFACQFRLDAFANSILFATADSNSTYGFIVWADNSGFNTGNANCYSIQFGNVRRIETEANSVEIGKVSTVVVVIDGGVGKVWIDGRRIIASGFGTVGAAREYYVRFGSTATGFLDELNGVVLAGAYARNKVIRDADAQAISANFYSLLQPANDTPYLYSVGGGTAPTLSSPTATSITATGATLGCTVTF